MHCSILCYPLCLKYCILLLILYFLKYCYECLHLLFDLISHHHLGTSVHFNCIFSVFSAVYFPQQHLPHYQLSGPDSRQTGLGGCHPTHVRQTWRKRGRGTCLQHVTGAPRHHQGRYSAARDRVVTPNHRSHGGWPGNQNQAFYTGTVWQVVGKYGVGFRDIW